MHGFLTRYTILHYTRTRGWGGAKALDAHTGGGGEGTGGREGGIDASRCGARGRDIQARIISLIHTQLQGKRERAAWPWCAHSKREDNQQQLLLIMTVGR